MSVEKSRVTDLLYQALETELGGVAIYEAAVGCAVNPDLKKEWTKYLAETRNHVKVLREVFGKLGLDTAAQSPGRAVVRHIGNSLREAIELAESAGDPAAAQVVAAECIVLAETKDHMNWELIGKVAESSSDPEVSQLLLKAYDEIEDQEDEHYYHTSGWARELWLDSLGIPALLPPPEEIKKVSTKIGAAKAEASREQMLDPVTSND